MTNKAQRLYAQAGVDLAKAHKLLSQLSSFAQTNHPRKLAPPGFFASLLDLSFVKAYREPVLASTTDGVGTKLLLAKQSPDEFLETDYSGLGQDLVAMCANDLLCTGAQPLIFLDYLATCQLDQRRLSAVLRGIAKSCKALHCSLAGGETAQLPGLIHEPHFDLAGFCLGVAEKSKLLGPHRVETGHAILGLAASGPHCNGFSLIRRLLPNLGRELLVPTPLYSLKISPILQRKQDSIRAIAHITGGGLIENLPRILPDTVGANIHLNSWPRLPILERIRKAAKLSDLESLSIFNGGLGLVLICPEEDTSELLQDLHSSGTKAFKIGTTRPSQSENKLVFS